MRSYSCTGAGEEKNTVLAAYMPVFEPMTYTGLVAVASSVRVEHSVVKMHIVSLKTRGILDHEGDETI